MGPAVDVALSTAGPRLRRMRVPPLLALLPLAAAACTPARGHHACAAGPLEVLTEQPDQALDCAAVTADVELVRAALEASAPERWRLEPGAFELSFAGLAVRVHPEPTFGRDGRSWVGRFSVEEGVELGSRGDALPHELLHVLDVERGRVFTGLHWGWDWEFDDEVTGQMSGGWTP